MASKITYQQAGVSIDANDEMVGCIRKSVHSTYGPRVMVLENGFAGLFRLDYDEKLIKKNYKNPVLVACTDGVGTKLLIAQAMNRLDTIGIDLVAMNVNDMLVQGAEPLFFLDYLAVHKLIPERIAQMVVSIAAGCKMADCALIGGETAEMPDLYGPDEYDMAGFCRGGGGRKEEDYGRTNQPGERRFWAVPSGTPTNRGNPGPSKIVLHGKNISNKTPHEEWVGHMWGGL